MWTLFQAAVLKGRDEQELDLFAVDCDLPCSSADIIIQVNMMIKLQRILLPRMTSYFRQKCRFCQKFCQKSWILPFSVILNMQYIHWLSMFWVCCQKCRVILTNSFIRNKWSMTIITNSDFTSDITNMIKLSILVLWTFNMLLLIYRLIWTMVAMK